MPEFQRRAVLILAAGHGTRMKSELPKVLHPVLGEPMLAHVLRTAHALEPDRVIVITGHGRDQVDPWVMRQPSPCELQIVEQIDPRGTGHAVQFALPHLHDIDEVIVLYGDVPLLRPETLRALIESRKDAPIALLAARPPDAERYGRVLLDEAGAVSQIVEYADANKTERKIGLVNAGMMTMSTNFLRESLSKLDSDNAQGELYLTDLMGMASEAGSPGACCVAEDWSEVQGVNTRVQCAEVTRALRSRINLAHMTAGVALLEPETAWIEASVTLAPDTIIGASCELRGQTSVARGAEIQRGCVLVDVEVGQDALFKPYSVATESRVGPSAQIGPFAHLRPGTLLHAEVKVGNFVETKKAELHEGVKASHLSYLGDAEIGAKSNIGAGTITCNYDGKNKFRTVLGEGVFVGSDTQLVAPVTVGDGAYIGAGTTVTKDISSQSLAISRVRQRNIEGWVTRKSQKEAAKPENKGEK